MYRCAYTACHVQRGKQASQPQSMFGLDASLLAAFGKLLKSLVPKALDHSFCLNVSPIVPANLNRKQLALRRD
jgi:hypothetical protein